MFILKCGGEILNDFKMVTDKSWPFGMHVPFYLLSMKTINFLLRTGAMATVFENWLPSWILENSPFLD